MDFSLSTFIIMIKLWLFFQAPGWGEITVLIFLNWENSKKSLVQQKTCNFLLHIHISQKRSISLTKGSLDFKYRIKIFFVKCYDALWNKLKCDPTFLLLQRQAENFEHFLESCATQLARITKNVKKPQTWM